MSVRPEIVSEEEARSAMAQGERTMAQQKVENSLTRRIVEAFQTCPMSPTEQRAIEALLESPGRSAGRISSGAGWGRPAWQMHFGKLCRSREHLLWAAPPDQEKPNTKLYCGILADFDLQTRGYTLKREAAIAFEELGLRPRAR